MTHDLTYDEALQEAIDAASAGSYDLEHDADPQRVQAAALLSQAWAAIADQLVMHDQDGEPVEVLPPLQVVPDEPDPEPEGEHRCEDCGRTFDSPQGLGGHRRIHNIDREPDHQTERKHCPRCDRTLDAQAFNRNASSHDGLQTWCRACQRDYRENRDDEATPGGDGDQVTVDEAQGEGVTQADSTETVTPSTNGTAAPGDITAIVEQLDPPVETQDGGCLLIVACTGCGAWHEQALDATPLAGHEEGWETAAVAVDQAMHEKLHDGCPGERVTARLEPKIGAGEDVRSSWDVIRKQTVSVGGAP